MLLRSPGGVQRGPAPSDGGLGVSPRSNSIPGRVGGQIHAHVTATTPTLPTLTGRRIDTRPATPRESAEKEEQPSGN